MDQGTGGGSVSTPSSSTVRALLGRNNSPAVARKRPRRSHTDGSESGNISDVDNVPPARGLVQRVPRPAGSGTTAPAMGDAQLTQQMRAIHNEFDAAYRAARVGAATSP